MKIQKVLNNNAAVSRDENGGEIIVMGCGLAFQLRAGDIIDPKKVEKTFRMEDRSLAGKFQKLIESIPMEHMMISEQIIKDAKQTLGDRLQDTIYITLPDHISGSILRFQEGIVLKNPLLWDIRRFYQAEYAIGLRALNTIKEHTGVVFSEDEAAYIALHFVNAQMEMPAAYEITSIMQEIYAIIRDFFHSAFEESSLDYYRFMTHLRFFAQRICTGDHYSDGIGDMLELIRKKHPEAYECACRVQKYTNTKYHFPLSEDELLYLTAHIARVAKHLSSAH